MAAPEKTYDRLVERAGTQHGFVRIEDLNELGISQVYLRRLATTGRADHRARGLYRLTAIPVTANDEFHEAVLWAGDGAAIAGEAALALWDLADVNPRRIDVAVPAGRRLPRRYDNGRFRVRSARMGSGDIDFVDQVPVVVPAVAIAQVIERGMDGTLVAQAITAAAGRGLLGQLAEARLRVAVADRGQRAGRGSERT